MLETWRSSQKSPSHFLCIAAAPNLHANMILDKIHVDKHILVLVMGGRHFFHHLPCLPKKLLQFLSDLLVKLLQFRPNCPTDQQITFCKWRGTFWCWAVPSFFWYFSSFEAAFCFFPLEADNNDDDVNNDEWSGDEDDDDDCHQPHALHLSGQEAWIGFSGEEAGVEAWMRLCYEVCVWVVWLHLGREAWSAIIPLATDSVCNGDAASAGAKAFSMSSLLFRTSWHR